MSRRNKRPLPKRFSGDRGEGARAFRGLQGKRPNGDRSGSKPAHASSPVRPPKPLLDKSANESTPLPTKVQTVMVTPDEGNMRVDRFLEARFPGLSFSHIQRIVRKGELRVNGKRADSKDRLQAGQSVRIPPLRLDAPKASAALSEAESRTLQQIGRASCRGRS